MDPYSLGARLVGIALRTAHLFAMAVFVGGVWLASPAEAIHVWRTLAFVSGFALLASELTHGGGWAWQVRGIATMAHVAALGLLAVGGLDRAATALAVLVGAAGSHAPKAIRKWSPWSGRAGDGGDAQPPPRRV